MSNIYFAQATQLIISTVFGIFILLVMLRLVLQLVRADFYNPFSQFIVKFTNWGVTPLKKIIPNIKNFDTASLILMLLIQALEIFLSRLVAGHGSDIPGLLTSAIGELLALFLNVFLITTIVQVILSWVAPSSHSPITSLIYSINEPVMGRVRRMLPDAGGIDFSPMVVMLGIMLVKILLVAPISDIGHQLI